MIRQYRAGRLYKPQMRHMHLAIAATADIRTASFQDREHFVVPVVALVEGVVYAMNAPGPELVLADEFGKSPAMWNAKPVLGQHPLTGDAAGSACTPRILEREAFGTIFEAALDGDALVMEAWLDKGRANRPGSLGERVLERLAKRELIEVSVGAWVVSEPRAGVWKDGTRYVAVWREIAPDHLAMLPEGDTGACSCEMGCGAPRVAQRVETEPGVYILRAEPVPQPKAAPVVPEPAQEGKPMKSRAARIKALVAHPKVVVVDGLLARLAAAPEAQLEEFEQAAEAGQLGVPERSAIGRLLDWFRVGESMSDVDIRTAIDRALRSEEPGYLGIDSLFPDDTLVVYAVAPEDSVLLLRRSYAFADDGSVTLGTEREEVRPVTKFEPVQRAAAAAASSVTTPPAPCGCGGAATPPVPAAAPAALSQGDAMTKAERIAAIIAKSNGKFTEANRVGLESLDEVTLTALEAYAEHPAAAAAAPAPVAAPAPTPAPVPAPVVQPVAAAAAPALTQDQVLEMFPDLKRVVNERQAADATRKSTLVGRLKTGQTHYTEAQLTAMTIEQLEGLAAIMKVNTPTDFSVLGSRAAAAVDEETPEDAPSLIDSVRTLRAAAQPAA